MEWRPGVRAPEVEEGDSYKDERTGEGKMMSVFARVVIAIRIPMVARTGPRPPGHRCGTEQG